MSPETTPPATPQNFDPSRRSFLGAAAAAAGQAAPAGVGGVRGPSEPAGVAGAGRREARFSG